MQNRTDSTQAALPERATLRAPSPGGQDSKKAVEPVSPRKDFPGLRIPRSGSFSSARGEGSTSPSGYTSTTPNERTESRGMSMSNLFMNFRHRKESTASMSSRPDLASQRHDSTDDGAVTPRESLTTSTGGQSLYGAKSPASVSTAVLVSQYQQASRPSMNAKTSLSTYDSRTLAAVLEKLEIHRPSMFNQLVPGQHQTTQSLGSSTDDVWQNVCVKVLPIFNGEGHQGFIEDLNDDVARHVKRSVERSPVHAIANLTSDLAQLLDIGMLTLASKLNNPLHPLSSDKLASRTVEIWTFFFGGPLPYLQGIFLPLETDEALLKIAARGRSASSPTAASRRASNDPRPSSRPAKPINVRGLALKSFRDKLILPNYDQLLRTYAQVRGTASRRSSSVDARLTEAHGITQAATLSSTSSHAQSKRLQMTAMLAALRTQDEAQRKLDHLLSAHLYSTLERDGSDEPVDPAQ
ncbi:uncharacterized protein L969DRAFT_92306 [Mixia osmundae IAM 14324]|uniref:HbrB-like protein n=1 Tax=Mixia osmundae (strain CBS 9802 / IAM 14324 / JCM 22182 / KY 12970) TaxID=764103 RepID=G7DTC8_MIXOS|nr:uncharacterized protein L969DRAFT_92306 [Mixia osmundae IAM 14324]KEI42888.1 hypothetical protein L969DRAFT_92306 [Mixia osmundae IAM 14324]GAA93775.1 hypothetical protein E5Q_00421 [Mixia osmundae IAM 14324]